MGPPGVVQGTSQWYLSAHHGEMVMRVHPGMLLGETAAGELSFDASCAQLKLDIADDGGLVLSAVDHHVMESAGGTRCHREHLARHRGAEIRLPHNVLQLDTDFVDPAQADETVEIPPPRPTEDITEPRVGRFPEGLLGNPADAMIAARPPHPPGADEQTVGEGLADRPTERTGARRQRILSPLMAALIGLAGIGFALLYPALREGGVPGPSPTVGAGPAPQTAPAQAPSAVAGSTGPGADALPSAIPLPPKPLLLPARDAPPATEPDGREEVAERPGERLPEPGPAAAPAIEPVVRQPVERPSIPQVAQTVGAAEAVAGPETIDSQPDAVVAELEERRETTQAPAAELARRRALFAADLALAQGRLTTPPEASAYTLYSRVLALDPGSPEARNGLQSVRDELVNRALAQLAGGALDDARRSLQAAADSGADPLLVARLRGEVDYRQRLIDTRAGSL